MPPGRTASVGATARARRPSMRIGRAASADGRTAVRNNRPSNVRQLSKHVHKHTLIDRRLCATLLHKYGTSIERCMSVLFAYSEYLGMAVFWRPAPVSIGETERTAGRAKFHGTGSGPPQISCAVSSATCRAGPLKAWRRALRARTRLFYQSVGRSFRPDPLGMVGWRSRIRVSGGRVRWIERASRRMAAPGP